MTNAPERDEKNQSALIEARQAEAESATSRAKVPADLERAHLDIESIRLEIEKDRLIIERARAAHDQRFWNRNSGTLITAIVSLAAVLVSLGQVWSTKISKDKELEIASTQRTLEIEKMEHEKEKELEMLDAQKTREWRLNVANFVMTNRKALFTGSPDEQRLFAKIIPTIFPGDISDSLLVKLESASPAQTRIIWRQARERTDSKPGDSTGNSFFGRARILQVLVTNAADSAPVAGVIVTTRGSMVDSPPTDLAGKTSLMLPGGTRPGETIFLNLVNNSSSRGWMMISPWDGHVIVPSSANSFSYVSIVVTRSLLLEDR